MPNVFAPFHATQLTQLSNGDLWRGVPAAEVELRPDNVTAPDAGTADDAMEQIVRSAKGSHTLSCLWCGVQYGRQQYNEMREHVEKDHKRATMPANGTDKLAAALKFATDALAVKNDAAGAE